MPFPPSHAPQKMPLGIWDKPFHHVVTDKAVWGEQRLDLGLNLSSTFYYPCALNSLSLCSQMSIYQMGVIIPSWLSG